MTCRTVPVARSSHFHVQTPDQYNTLILVECNQLNHLKILYIQFYSYMPIWTCEKKKHRNVLKDVSRTTHILTTSTMGKSSHLQRIPTSSHHQVTASSLTSSSFLGWKVCVSFNGRLKKVLPFRELYGIIGFRDEGLMKTFISHLYNLYICMLSFQVAIRIKSFHLDRHPQLSTNACSWYMNTRQFWVFTPQYIWHLSPSAVCYRIWNPFFLGHG